MKNSPRQKAQLRNCELTWVIGGCYDFDDKDDDDNMMIKMMYTWQGNADRREKARSYLLDFHCLDVLRADCYWHYYVSIENLRWFYSHHNIFDLDAWFKKPTFILSVHTLFNWLFFKHIYHVQLTRLIISSSWPDRLRACAGEELRAGDLAPWSTAAPLPPGS